MGQADQEADQTGERGGAGAESAGSLTANMIGDLLMAGRSVSFDYNRAAGVTRVFSGGSTSVINPKVADNNSPLPQDRIAFRYNFFHDSLAVTGIGRQGLSEGVSPAGFLLQSAETTTKSYDVNQYTFQFEKTFLDGRASAELRLPIQNTLSSNLNLNAGAITGISSIAAASAPNYPRFQGMQALDVFNVTATPEQTLGSERTELGNISLILKALFHQSREVALSGGLGLGMPTANNTRVRVTDYEGDLNLQSVEIQRVRQFDVKNETWGLSPFLAALYTPGARFFAQGFLQVDVPLNTSKVTYTETALLLNPSVNRFGTRPDDPTIQVPPFTVTGHLREQVLMHFDLGTGYWLVRDPEASWLTGLAPTLEMHYTSTLNSADLLTLPRDSSAIPTPTGGLRTEANPTVGNRRGQVAILDLTAGTTLFLAERATLATAVSVPLRTGENRTFDWEFHVQLNWYFGGPGRRGTFAPTF
jgi:hypothetical protein